MLYAAATRRTEEVLGAAPTIYQQQLGASVRPGVIGGRKGMAMRLHRESADQPGRRARGELESEVLAALWAAQGPRTATEVQQALAPGEAESEGGVAYNTVQTILTRLHDKGLVLREQQGRAHAYWPARGQAELAAEQMNQLMARGPSHTAVLQRFVSTLSAAEERTLRDLLDATDATDAPAHQA